MRIWHQQDCEDCTEVKYLISQPKCLGKCILSLIHSNNLNSRKSRGRSLSSSSKSVGGKVQRSSNNINKTSLWQMACTGILCHKAVAINSSCSWVWRDLRCRYFPSGGKKAQPEPHEMAKHFPLTFKAEQKQLWKIYMWCGKQITISPFIHGAKSLKENTAARCPQ